MTQKTFSVMAKVILVIFAVIGSAFFGGAVPFYGLDLVQSNPEFSSWFLPWLLFIELLTVPCCLVIVLCWQVASSIRDGCSFNMRNAARVRVLCITWLAAFCYFLVGNVVLLLCGMNHPGVVILSFVAAFIGIALAAAAAILSYLAGKAAKLQEESDLTI